MILGHKLIVKAPAKTPLTADLFTGKDVIDREEEEFLAEKAAKRRHSPGGWFYRNFVSWLF